MPEGANGVRPEYGKCQSGLRTTKAGKMRLPTLADIDKRTAAYRDATVLIDQVIGERGGADQVDVVRQASAETWAVLTTQLRAMQVQWLSGQPIDWAEFTTIANARRREGETLGAPAPRDVTSLADRIMGHD